jgi:hypothetical protein
LMSDNDALQAAIPGPEMAGCREVQQQSSSSTITINNHHHQQSSSSIIIIINNCHQQSSSKPQMATPLFLSLHDILKKNSKKFIEIDGKNF